MKVLHIIKSLGRGGAEMLLQETLKLHDKQSFDFHYMYFLPWKNQMVGGLEAAGGKVVNLPAKNNFRIMLKTGEIIRYIRNNNIELVHCHLPWAGFVGRLIHKRTGIPVIYTEHNKQERYHILTKTMNRLTFNWQSKVIAVSGDVETSIRTWIRPRVPVQTILNGVNTGHFVRNQVAGEPVRKQLGLSPDNVLIGTIAVFRFQKRLKEWIDVFRQLHERHPHVRGCIVGDGPLKGEILRHLKEQGMEEFISFPGLQTDVLPWLSAMDIFMMTSEFEGLPVALLEAMSTGCAVVCTDAGGIKEVIRPGQDGFMLPVEEWKEPVKPLSQLVENRAMIREYGEKARQRVIESFSLRAMVGQIEEVYHQTVKH
jgi:glycosyltransferase involved in cell wall biosynthesis